MDNESIKMADIISQVWSVRHEVCPRDLTQSLGRYFGGLPAVIYITGVGGVSRPVDVGLVGLNLGTDFDLPTGITFATTYGVNFRRGRPFTVLSLHNVNFARSPLPVGGSSDREMRRATTLEYVPTSLDGWRPSGILLVALTTAYQNQRRG